SLGEQRLLEREPQEERRLHPRRRDVARCTQPRADLVERHATVISAEPRDAYTVEHAVRAVDGGDPLAIGAEVLDDRVDVDPMRRRPELLEQDQRLREQMDRAARRAAPGAEVERRRELHEGLEERAVLHRRLLPRILPDALGAQIAAEV